MNEEEAVFVGGVDFVVADWEGQFEGALEVTLCDAFFDEFVALDIEVDLAFYFKLLRANEQLHLIWVHEAWQAHDTEQFIFFFIEVGLSLHVFKVWLKSVPEFVPKELIPLFAPVPHILELIKRHHRQSRFLSCLHVTLPLEYAETSGEVPS